jgi:hypothetical protein
MSYGTAVNDGGCCLLSSRSSRENHLPNRRENLWLVLNGSIQVPTCWVREISQKVRLMRLTDLMLRSLNPVHPVSMRTLYDIAENFGYSKQGVHTSMFVLVKQGLATKDRSIRANPTFLLTPETIVEWNSPPDQKPRSGWGVEAIPDTPQGERPVKKLTVSSKRTKTHSKEVVLLTPLQVAQLENASYTVGYCERELDGTRMKLNLCVNNTADAKRIRDEVRKQFGIK